MSFGAKRTNREFWVIGIMMGVFFAGSFTIIWAFNRPHFHHPHHDQDTHDQLEAMHGQLHSLESRFAKMGKLKDSAKRAYSQDADFIRNSLHEAESMLEELHVRSGLGFEEYLDEIESIQRKVDARLKLIEKSKKS